MIIEEEGIIRMVIKIYIIDIIVICMMVNISNLINRNSSIINNIIQINNKQQETLKTTQTIITKINNKTTINTITNTRKKYKMINIQTKTHFKTPIINLIKHLYNLIKINISNLQINKSR